jgi:predicted ribosome quality control (RQC) complex YloA/Tae2 family protein
MNENINFTLKDIHLLKIGRHLRLSDKVKAVIGRNESENEKLMTFVEEGDAIIEKNALTGPLTVLKGEISDEIKLLAGSITASYGKGNDLDSIEMSMKKIPGDDKELFLVKPYIQEEIAKFFI